MPLHLWCHCIVCLCPHRSSPSNHKKSIGQDDTLWDRTVLSVQNIIELLGDVCTIHTSLSKISFMIRLRELQWILCYVQLWQTCTWNIWREKLYGLPPPLPDISSGMWRTLLSFNSRPIKIFLDHINSIDPVIQFTVEGNQDNGAIPFLDTLVTPHTDHSLSITVYCKPTHTDQY